LKVLIIGGGPAGSTAAYHLAKHYDVTLIQNRIWDKPCGGGVKTKILNSLQIPKKLIKHQLDYVDMIYKN
jgi:geranylgeranyl reductase